MYGLGATLYALHDRTIGIRRLRPVRGGPRKSSPVSSRLRGRCAATSPRPWKAVCLKAMAPRPEGSLPLSATAGR